MNKIMTIDQNLKIIKLIFYQIEIFLINSKMIEGSKNILMVKANKIK